MSSLTRRVGGWIASAVAVAGLAVRALDPTQLGTWTGTGGGDSGSGVYGYGAGSKNNPRARMQAAENNSRLAAAVNRIAEDIACQQFYACEKDKDGHELKTLTGPLVDWLESPWKTKGGGSLFSLLWLTQTWLETCREAFWLIIRSDSTADPTEVWPLPPSWIVSVPNGNWPFYGFCAPYEELPTWIPAGEVIWIKRPTMQDPFGRGVSAAWAIDDQVVFGDQAARYLNGFFRNSARPDLVFFIENATKDDANRIRKEWEQRHRGVLNSHRIEVLPANGKVQQMTPTFADMTLVELLKANRDEIWQFFGLSPEVMGAVENSNRASIEAASYHHSLYVLTPKLVFLVGELNRLWCPMFGRSKRSPYWGRKVRLAYPNPVRETEQFILEKTIQGYTNGLLRRVEGRQALKLDPMGDGRDEDVGQPLSTVPIGPDNKPRPWPKGDGPSQPETTKSISALADRLERFLDKEDRRNSPSAQDLPSENRPEDPFGQALKVANDDLRKRAS